MAHGIAGPLALLCLAARQDILVPGQISAISRICTWLTHSRATKPQGPGWPGILDPNTSAREYLSESPMQRAPVPTARPSWCYGTAGLARAVQLAGLTLGDPGLREVAEEAIIVTLQGAPHLNSLTEPGLCHGRTGLLYASMRVAADATDQNRTRLTHRIADLRNGLIQDLLHRQPEHQGTTTRIGTHPNDTSRRHPNLRDAVVPQGRLVALTISGGRAQDDDEPHAQAVRALIESPTVGPGLLDGAAGIALALQAGVGSAQTGWPTFLLLG